MSFKKNYISANVKDVTVVKLDIAECTDVGHVESGYLMQQYVSWCNNVYIPRKEIVKELVLNPSLKVIEQSQAHDMSPSVFGTQGIVFDCIAAYAFENKNKDGMTYGAIYRAYSYYTENPEYPAPPMDIVVCDTEFPERFVRYMKETHGEEEPV